jgi:hypothetical protein
MSTKTKKKGLFLLNESIIWTRLIIIISDVYAFDRWLDTEFYAAECDPLFR